jgi:hypothetical protein
MSSHNSTQYATAADFCHTFHRDMTGLYLLSFLLTADTQRAEQCFVAGLEDSVDGSRVFKEWAGAWARRKIIQNAARIVHPRPLEGNLPSQGTSVESDSQVARIEKPEIRAVLDLESFDRFVFVMSVLEHYSDHDCAVLLGRERRDVVAARNRALQQIGNAKELRSKGQETAREDTPILPHEHNSTFEVRPYRLVTSTHNIAPSGFSG